MDFWEERMAVFGVNRSGTGAGRFLPQRCNSLTKIDKEISVPFLLEIQQFWHCRLAGNSGEKMEELHVSSLVLLALRPADLGCGFPFLREQQSSGIIPVGVTWAGQRWGFPEPQSLSREGWKLCVVWRWLVALTGLHICEPASPHRGRNFFWFTLWLWFYPKGDKNIAPPSVLVAGLNFATIQCSGEMHRPLQKKAELSEDWNLSSSIRVLPG